MEINNNNKHILAINEFIPAATAEIILFCLLISGNYIGELFSCSIQRSFSKNRIHKHILGILTLYFFVTALDNKKLISPIMYLFTSIITYCWFVIITLTPKRYTAIIMSTLIFIYLFNDINNHFKLITEGQKFILFAALFGGAIITSLIGCYKYYSIKRGKFGKTFTIKKFFFGKNECA